tara:strand:+ start:1193 stop:4162 length:2970 start_codon:yes stop_codon:yes gene_type:complete
MAISVGEGYSLLGQGFAKSAQGNLSEQRKMMKEAQRRQLITAALTPVAQGVGQFATDLISAPFKDAASNFYNRGAGKGLNANRKAYRSLEKQAKDRMSEINKQGKYKYFEPLATQAKEAYENKYLLELGEDYKNHTVYRQGLVELPSLIRQQQDQEYNEALAEYNSYSDSPTQAQVSAAIKKYSPYATNPASWLYKKAKQIVLKQDSAEVEQRSLDVLQEHLSSYGMDLSDESLAKLRERNRTGSDAYFSADVINSMPQFKSQEFLNAARSFKDGDELRARINREGSGGEQNLLQELQKDNPRLVSSQQFEQGLRNKIFSFMESPNIEKSQKSYQSILATSKLPDSVLRYMEENNIEPNTDAALKFTNKLAAGAWETATLIHNRSLLSDPNAMAQLELGKGDTVKYTDNIRRIANYLIEEKSKEQTFELDGFLGFGTEKMGLVIDVEEFKNLQVPVSSSSTGDTSSSTSIGSTTSIKVALGNKQYAPVSAGLTQDLKNLVDSGRTPEGMREQLEVILTKVNSGFATSLASSEGGRPEDYSIEVLLTPFQEQIVADIRAGGTSDASLITDEDRANRNSPENVQRYLEQLRNTPSMFEDVKLINPDNPVVQLLNPFSKTTKSPEEMERINSERQQAITDYENRSSSEAFADVESGRDIVDPKLQVARETYKSNLRKPFQNISSLLETTPKSPERIAEIRKQRSAAIAEYEANKEPDVDSGPSILDSVIDFLLPKAEASRELKAEVSSKGTSIRRAAKRKQDSEMSRWEDKGTITVSNVYNDGSVIEVPTKNPIRFIQNNIDTPMEAVAIYYEALKAHNSERPSSATYQMKPLTQAMTWAYEAFPDQLPNLERMYFNRVKNKESGRSLLKLIESPSNEKEIKAYTAKVSKMSDSEKEKEFNKQLKIARKIKIETDSDLAANAVAYRKLQSIFGEEDNRVIGKEGTTVSSKVDQYYNYLLPTKGEDYDLITKVYEQVLADVNPPAAFSLLAQR